MDFKNRPIIINDLDSCKPDFAFSKKFTKEKWRIIDYETEDFSGKILAASPESIVPEIYYDLNKEGWYAIWANKKSND